MRTSEKLAKLKEKKERSFVNFWKCLKNMSLSQDYNFCNKIRILRLTLVIFFYVSRTDFLLFLVLHLPCDFIFFWILNKNYAIMQNIFFNIIPLNFMYSPFALVIKISLKMAVCNSFLNANGHIFAYIVSIPIFTTKMIFKVIKYCVIFFHDLG